MRKSFPMDKTTGTLLIAALFLFGACSEETPLAPESDLLVVTAYLYTAQPVRDIKLTGTLPLDTEETLPPPVNDAHVSLIEDGHRYLLELAPGDSGYYHYIGDDLSIDPGDEFLLEIDYDGQIISARTVVPPAPETPTLSAVEMSVDPEAPPIPFFRGEEDTDQAEPLTASWQGEEEAYYFVEVESIEPEPIPIEWAFSRNTPLNALFLRDNSFTIQPLQVAYFGAHRIRIFRANQEYADLLQFGTQDPNELSEPPSNIDNGVGIFTSFSSADLLFDVTLAQEE
jgi:hypothetical protein